MTARPPVVRAVTSPTYRLTSYVNGRESYQTDHARGVLTYTAPCATCLRLAEYTAVPGQALTVWCPTCEAGAA